MITSRTTTASKPVAACRLSAETLSESALMMRMAIIQVTRRGEEGEPCAPGDGPATVTPRAGHAGGDGGENENALQSFAEDENADIENGDVATGVGAGGIG